MIEPRSPEVTPLPAAKAPWAPPTIVELPKLTELTLQSGNPVGGIGSGGGTVC